MHNIDLRYRSCLGGRAHGSDRGVKRHGGSATSLGHLRGSFFEPIHDHGHGEGTGDPPTLRASGTGWRVGARGDEVEALLRELRGRHDTWVFARESGRRLGYKFALQAFKDAQEAAGLGEYRLHDCRRSVARRLEQGGIPRSTAMRITGHRTEHLFRQYAVGEDEDVRKALSAVLSTVETEEA